MQVLKVNNADHWQECRSRLVELRDLIDALLLTVRVAKEVKAFKSFSGYLFIVEEPGAVTRI